MVMISLIDNLFIVQDLAAKVRETLDDGEHEPQ